MIHLDAPTVTPIPFGETAAVRRCNNLKVPYFIYTTRGKICGNCVSPLHSGNKQRSFHTEACTLYKVQIVIVNVIHSGAQGPRGQAGEAGRCPDCMYSPSYYPYQYQQQSKGPPGDFKG